VVMYRVSVIMSVLPDGNGGFAPCPEVLTEIEAIRYLRLDVDGPTKPSLTLRHYREKGILRATRVGRRLRYRRIELERLLKRLTDGDDGTPQPGLRDVRGADIIHGSAGTVIRSGRSEKPCA